MPYICSPGFTVAGIFYLFVFSSFFLYAHNNQTVVHVNGFGAHCLSSKITEGQKREVVLGKKKVMFGSAWSLTPVHLIHWKNMVCRIVCICYAKLCVCACIVCWMNVQCLFKGSWKSHCKEKTCVSWANRSNHVIPELMFLHIFAVLKIFIKTVQTRG